MVDHLSQCVAQDPCGLNEPRLLGFCWFGPPEQLTNRCLKIPGVSQPDTKFLQLLIKILEIYWYMTLLHKIFCEAFPNWPSRRLGRLPALVIRGRAA
jgi:hypothetical protein